MNEADGRRAVEALLFAAAGPLSAEEIAARVGGDVSGLLEDLRADYAARGINLVEVAGKWTFRTSPDLAWVLAGIAAEPRRLSRAALETLAIVAYHQPVTRAEIEDIRGVGVNRGTLDLLMELGWVRMRGRRRTPGRPVTYGTTEGFLVHFGLERLADLPGLDELRGAGLLEGNVPPGFAIPVPSDAARADEDALDGETAEDYDTLGDRGP